MNETYSPQFHQATTDQTDRQAITDQIDHALIAPHLEPDESCVCMGCTAGSQCWITYTGDDYHRDFVETGIVSPPQRPTDHDENCDCFACADTADDLSIAELEYRFFMISTGMVEPDHFDKNPLVAFCEEHIQLVNNMKSDDNRSIYHPEDHDDYRHYCDPRFECPEDIMSEGNHIFADDEYCSDDDVCEMMSCYECCSDVDPIDSVSLSAFIASASALTFSQELEFFCNRHVAIVKDLSLESAWAKEREQYYKSLQLPPTRSSEKRWYNPFRDWTFVPPFRGWTFALPFSLERVYTVVSFAETCAIEYLSYVHSARTRVYNVITGQKLRSGDYVRFLQYTSFLSCSIVVNYFILAAAVMGTFPFWFFFITFEVGLIADFFRTLDAMDRGLDFEAPITIFVLDCVANKLRAIGVPRWLTASLQHFDNDHLFGNMWYSLSSGFDIRHFPASAFTVRVLDFFGVEAIGSSGILSGTAIMRFYNGEWSVREKWYHLYQLFGPSYFGNMSAALHSLIAMTSILFHEADIYADADRFIHWSSTKVHTLTRPLALAILKFVLPARVFGMFFTSVDALPVQSMRATQAPFWISTSSPTFSPISSQPKVDHGHVTIDLPAVFDVPTHLHWVMVASIGVLAFLAFTKRKVVKVSGPGCNFSSSAKDVPNTKYRIHRIGIESAVLVPCAQNFKPNWTMMFLQRQVEKKRLVILDASQPNEYVYVCAYQAPGQKFKNTLHKVFPSAFAKLPKSEETLMFDEVSEKQSDVDFVVDDDFVASAWSNPLSFTFDETRLLNAASFLYELYVLLTDDLSEPYAPSAWDESYLSEVKSRAMLVSPALKASVATTWFMKGLDVQLVKHMNSDIYETFFRDIFKSGLSAADAFDRIMMVPKLIRFIAYGIGEIDDLFSDKFTRVCLKADDAISFQAATGPSLETIVKLRAAVSMIDQCLLEPLPAPQRSSLLSKHSKIKALLRDTEARFAKPQSLNIMFVSNSGRNGKTSACNKIAEALCTEVFDIPKKDVKVGVFACHVEFQSNMFADSQVIIANDLLAAADPKVQMATALLVHGAAGGEPFEIPKAAVEEKGQISCAKAWIVTSNKIGMQLDDKVLTNPVQFQQRFPICVEAISNGQRRADGHSKAIVAETGDIVEVTYDITIFAPALDDNGNVVDPINVYRVPHERPKYAQWCKKGATFNEMLRCVVEICKLIKLNNEYLCNRDFLCPGCDELVCKCDFNIHTLGTPSYMPTAKPTQAEIDEAKRKYRESRRKWIASALTWTPEPVPESVLKFILAHALSKVSEVSTIGWFLFLSITALCGYVWMSMFFALLTILSFVSAKMMSEAVYKLQQYRTFMFFLKKLRFLQGRTHLKLKEIESHFTAFDENTKLMLKIAGAASLLAAMGLILKRLIDSPSDKGNGKFVKSEPVVSSVDLAIEPPPGSFQKDPKSCLAHVKTAFPSYSTGIYLDSMSVLFPAHVLRGDNPLQIDGHKVNKQSITPFPGHDMAVARCNIASGGGCVPVKCWGRMRSGCKTGKYYTRHPQTFEDVTLEVNNLVYGETAGKVAQLESGITCYSGDCLWVHGMCGGVLVDDQDTPIAVGVAYSDHKDPKNPIYSVIFVEIMTISGLKASVTHNFTADDYRSAISLTTELSYEPSGLHGKPSCFDWVEGDSPVGVKVATLKNKRGAKPSRTREPYEFTERAHSLVGASVGDFVISDGSSVVRTVDGVSRKYSATEDYFSHSTIAYENYVRATDYDLGFDEPTLLARLDELHSTVPDPFLAKPVSVEEAIAGNKYVTGLVLSTAAGEGLGKKSDHISRRCGDQYVPCWLIAAVKEEVAQMRSLKVKPRVFGLSVKRDEILKKEKAKNRTINVSTHFAVQIAERVFLLKIVEWLIRNGEHYGFMPGVNMHDPKVIEKMYNDYAISSASDDIEKMEAFHAAVLKRYSTEFILGVARRLGYDETEVEIVRLICVSLDYPAVLVGFDAIALAARNASGHVLTTWINCIRVLLSFVMWCIKHNVPWEELLFMIFGDDQTRRQNSLEAYQSLAEYVGKVGFKMCSAKDKSKPTDPGGLDKFEFLKRTIEEREGIYYAPLAKLSIVKSLMYPRHKQGRMDMGDFKNTVSAAMRESYIAGTSDVMDFCLELDTHYDLGLSQLPRQLHEQYVSRQFSFDYVKPEAVEHSKAGVKFLLLERCCA